MAYGCFGIYRVARRIAQEWRAEYVDFGSRFYTDRLKRHYAGIGHQDLQNTDNEQRMALYAANSPSRLAPYLDAHPTVLDCRDGETFLDAGCGRGPEIKEMLARFPTSKITGLDISHEALAVVRSGTAAEGRVETRQGSLYDSSLLAAIPDGSIDHVLLSHVIPYLMGAGVSDSKAQRQGVIDHLVRIARRTVTILTDRVERRTEPWLTPVLIDAALFRDDLPGYLEKHLVAGERYTLTVELNHSALVLRKYPAASQE